jgi:hypothetical protein
VPKRLASDQDRIWKAVYLMATKNRSTAAPVWLVAVNMKARNGAR